MGNWIPGGGGRLVSLSSAAGLWWSRSHEKVRGVWCPTVMGLEGLGVGKVGTSGENRMSLEQGGESHGSTERAVATMSSHVAPNSGGGLAASERNGGDSKAQAYLTFFFFCFLGRNRPHVEVPRLGVE